jgi:hypothetical protein
MTLPDSNHPGHAPRPDTGTYTMSLCPVRSGRHTGQGRTLSAVSGVSGKCKSLIKRRFCVKRGINTKGVGHGPQK